MTSTGQPIRDRIRELRRVPASALLANPKNWRRHPAAQQAALRGVLAEIGYADALLARETPEGHVYEPFAGSGTTLIACERLKRRCYAMEIEPRYVDVSVRRWEQYAGKKAVLA